MNLETAFPGRRWWYVAACAIAGALAVPLHAAATPISAVAAALAGLVGLHIRRWSRLPQPERNDGPGPLWRRAAPGLWLLLGLAVGLLLLAAIRTLIEPAIPSIGARIAKAGTLPVWRRALVIYVAAVGEELVFRLLLLSAITGVIVRLLRLPGGRPTPLVVWLANLVSALAFAAVHLPSWSGAAPMSPGLAASVLALNAVGGLVVGYVFARHGIAAATWTHAGADCAIQLVGPLTG